MDLKRKGHEPACLVLNAHKLDYDDEGQVLLLLGVLDVRRCGAGVLPAQLEQVVLQDAIATAGLALALAAALPASASAQDPPPGPAMPGSFEQLGHEPLMSRGMNAGLAVLDGYVVWATLDAGTGRATCDSETPNMKTSAMPSSFDTDSCVSSEG